MSQDYQGVGQAGAALEAVAGRREGWPGDVPADLGVQATDPETSFYAERANRQALGRAGRSMAAHEEAPMAARAARPFEVTP